MYILLCSTACIACGNPHCALLCAPRTLCTIHFAHRFPERAALDFHQQLVYNHQELPHETSTNAFFVHYPGYQYAKGVDKLYRCRLHSALASEVDVQVTKKVKAGPAPAIIPKAAPARATTPKTAPALATTSQAALATTSKAGPALATIPAPLIFFGASEPHRG